MTNIYFIRHAESDFTVKEDTIRPLTAKGLSDSIKLIDYFKNIPISAIYSSPYKRVLQTVDKIAGKLNLPILEIADLRERKIGSWVENFSDFTIRQWSDFNYKLLAGESLAEVQQRNIKAINSIIEKHVNENIIIGTHGTALSTVLNFYSPSFNYCKFAEIVDIMPLIVIMKFEYHKFIDFSVEFDR